MSNTPDPAQFLGELPEPEYHANCYVVGGLMQDDTFTTEQMRAYALAAVQRALAAREQDEPAKTAEPLKGWKLNHVQYKRGAGTAEIGYLDPEDDRFSPIVTVDTGLYYQQEQAAPLAVAILGMLQDTAAPQQAAPAPEPVNAQMLAALKANHRWHQDYDDYGGYPESELCEQTTAAIAAAEAAQAQPAAAAQPVQADAPSVSDILRAVPDIGDKDAREAAIARTAFNAGKRAVQADALDARSDGMPASADERKLRRMYAVRVGMPNLYIDDGEASGSEHGIQIDFMREPVAHIAAKVCALEVARYECRDASPAPQADAQPPAQAVRLTDEQMSEALQEGYRAWGMAVGGSEAEYQGRAVERAVWAANGLRGE